MDDGPAEFKIKEEMRIRKYEEFLKKFKASQLRFTEYDPERIRFATTAQALIRLAFKVCDSNFNIMESL